MSPTIDSLRRLTVSSNVNQLGEARVIGLLDVRGDDKIRAFHFRVLQALCNPQEDMVLVEESADKEGNSMANEVARKLVASGVCVGGWCSARQDNWHDSLRKRLEETDQEIKVLTCMEDWLEGSRKSKGVIKVRRACAYLTAAAKHVWGSSEVGPAEYVEFLSAKNLQTSAIQEQKKYLIQAGQALMEKRRREWLTKTFPFQQRSLLASLERRLAECRRRVFFIASIPHGDPASSPYQNETRQFLEDLSKLSTFVVLNPDRVMRSDLNTLVVGGASSVALADSRVERRKTSPATEVDA